MRNITAKYIVCFFLLVLGQKTMPQEQPKRVAIDLHSIRLLPVTEERLYASKYVFATKDGRIKGIKILYAPPDGHLERLGLKSADLIQQVNGHALISKDPLPSLMRIIFQGAIASLLVERKGQLLLFAYSPPDNVSALPFLWFNHTVDFDRCEPFNTVDTALYKGIAAEQPTNPYLPRKTTAEETQLLIGKCKSADQILSSIFVKTATLQERKQYYETRVQWIKAKIAMRSTDLTQCQTPTECEEAKTRIKSLTDDLSSAQEQLR
ncbi:MAG TPA: hypothetical protein PKX74_06545 [Leptospiraceae bacterium]|nr:hypothetical protein [Leptospiraceae bacterium]HNN60737.1 hypothetical protein [Leptospiraceae bacterium]HNN77009.1 hypothetical protein [Leptospiraceae bacterium]